MDRHHHDVIAWVILTVGVLLILLGVWAWALVAAFADDCGSTGWACNETRWVLRYDGREVRADGDMTEEECLALRDELDPQTPPFSRLECVLEGATRHSS
jgi:hypothetical protein